MPDEQTETTAKTYSEEEFQAAVAKSQQGKDTLAAELAKAKSELKAINKQREEAEVAKVEKSGDVEALKAAHKKQLDALTTSKTSREAELLAQLDEQKSSIAKATRDSLLDRLTGELTDKSPTMVRSYLEKRVVVKHDEQGNLQTSFLGADFQPSALNEKQLKEEIYKNEEFVKANVLKLPVNKGSRETDTPTQDYNKPLYTAKDRRNLIIDRARDTESFHSDPRSRHLLKQAADADFKERIRERYQKGERAPTQMPWDEAPKVNPIEMGW